MRWLYRIPLIVIALLLIVMVSITVMSSLKERSLAREFENAPINDFQTLEVSGLSMAYREFGNPDDPTIVLVHGFLGSSYDYRYLTDLLSENYHVIALDLIGFGASDKPDDFEYTRENHATMIHQFIELKGIERFHLGGHSMGGGIAIYYAHLFPEKLDSLLLFASAGLSDGAPSPLPLPFYRWIIKNYYLQRLGFQSVHYQEHFQSDDYFDPMFFFTKQIPPETLRAFSMHQDTVSINEFIDDIAIPTLIVFGKEDSWIPPSVGETLNESLQNSQLILIEETGHIPFIEAIDETYDAVIDFLTSQ